MTGKQLRKYKRKNELHAPLTAQCACSLFIFNQKEGDNSIWNLINVRFVETLIYALLDTLTASHIAVDVSYQDIKKAGRTQTHQDDDRATITSSTIIKSKHEKKGNKNESL